MRNSIQREYARLRAKGWTASYAFGAAKTNVAFAEAEALGHVRIEHVSDDMPYEYGDAGDDPKWRAEVDRLIDSWGVWGIVAYYRDAVGDEHVADSCFGFIGNDLEDNGYDSDIKQSALDLLREEHEACVVNA